MPASRTAAASTEPYVDAAELALDELTAVSPIDGRYAARTAPLRELFSANSLNSSRSGAVRAA